MTDEAIKAGLVDERAPQIEAGHSLRALTGQDVRNVDNWFTYHAPKGDQTQRYALLRDKAKELGTLFLQCSPPCTDQTAAMRKLREAVMAMNLTIACNE